MCMNITYIINDIKLNEGLQTIALPYKEPIEVVLQQIIQGSIRTYSHYKPHIKECYDYKDHLKAPDDEAKKYNIFFIPSELTSTPVQDAYAYVVTESRQDAEVNTNAFTIGSPFVGFGSYYPQDILDATLTGAAINKYAGITAQPSTSKWLGSNRIQLFNVPEKSLLRFVAKVDHDINGETIPDSCIESFKQLATYDVQMTLYNTLINFQEVGAAHKSIQLKIDRWAGAQEKREALLQKWEETFHLDEIDELVQFF